MNRILITIINKNRSLYLENLIKSYDENFKTNYFDKKLIIIDSSDKKTELKKIEKLKTKYHLNILKPSINLLDGYLGKLYHKMNMAVEYAIEENFDYIFFLQEDTQFIRKVLNKDLKNIKKIFINKNIIHITSHFVKAFDISVLQNFIYISDNNFYLNKKSSSSDLGIYDVQKIKKINFRFQQSETKNDEILLAHGFNTALLFNPLINYLPWPTSARRYSGKNNNIIIRIFRFILIMINDMGTNSGFNPYHYLTEKEFNKMDNRKKYELPVGELYLKTLYNVKKPWSFDRVWDFNKFKNFKYIIKLSWIFDGSIDYINKLSKLDRLGLKNNYKREIEDE